MPQTYKKYKLLPIISAFFVLKLTFIKQILIKYKQKLTFIILNIIDYPLFCQILKSTIKTYS